MRTFVEYLMAFCSRREAASGVIFGRFVRPAVLDKLVDFNFVKFRDACLNRSREIPSEAVGGGIFDSFDIFDENL